MKEVERKVSYVVGIDVGGTNTYGVLLKKGTVLMTAKAPTEQDDLHRGTMQVISALLKATPRSAAAEIELHLSTTLTTNAIVQGKGLPTAALSSWTRHAVKIGLNFKLFPVTGYIDHRGENKPRWIMGNCGRF